MTRQKIKLLLAIIAVTAVMQSTGASRAQAQYYSWWGWRPAPIRRTLAIAAAPWVATWRFYYGAYQRAYRPGPGVYYNRAYYSRAFYSPGYYNRVAGCAPSSATMYAGGPDRLDPDIGAITINVPESAEVSVNGTQTQSEGATRRYYSRGLQAGKKYKFVVHVEREVAGEMLSDTKTVYLTGGSRSELKFDLPQSSIRQISAQPVETVLKLNLPADARVSLAGAETTSTGSERTYRTTKLRAGQTWDNYRIQAVVERGGRQLVEERTITLTAGETRELTIGFASDRVAAN